MSDKPVKFLMILNELAWFWSHRLPLAKAIQEKGWEFSVAAHEADKEHQFHEMGVTGCDLPRFGSLNILSQIYFMMAIYKIIKTDQPDIIHVITIRYAFYVGLVTRLMRL